MEDKSKENDSGVHLSPLVEWGEDELKGISQDDGGRYVDDGGGFWHIEDKQGNTTVIGASVPQSKNQCKACKEKILWKKTPKGRWTPVNEDGTPHWATCPAAKQFKKSDGPKG